MKRGIVQWYDSEKDHPWSAEYIRFIQRDGQEIKVSEPQGFTTNSHQGAVALGMKPFEEECRKLWREKKEKEKKDGGK